MREPFRHLATGAPVRETAWRGSRHPGPEFLSFRPGMPGLFFSSDPDYARSFGPYVHECEVSIGNPLVLREEDGGAVPGREELLSRGHDGLVMVFARDYFLVAADASQAVPLRVLAAEGPLPTTGP